MTKIELENGSIIEALPAGEVVRGKKRQVIHSLDHLSDKCKVCGTDITKTTNVTTRNGVMCWDCFMDSFTNTR